MNQPIRTITFEGELKVWGIYNYNGAWSILKKHQTESGSDFFSKHRCAYRTPSKRDNHIYAKTYLDNTGKEIDYTSSRCIRHELFKDLQPKQPSDKTFGDQFVKMVASEIGLLRGYMSPDEKGGNPTIKGLKRCSPLHIADAFTVDSNSINFDQGVSSKSKKEEEERKKKQAENKQEKEQKGTSLFSKDNAPCRTQKLSGGINLKELQFLSLDDVDNDFCMISKKDRDNFLKLLKEYFEKHNVNHHLEIKQYTDIEAIYQTKRDGILLNQEQILHLVKVVFQRIKMINGLKSGARLAYNPNSLKVNFFDGEDWQDVPESVLKDKLQNIAFYHFFKKV